MASEPPIGSLFSAFLGLNPIKQLLGPPGVLQKLPAGQAAYLLLAVRFFSWEPRAS